jgi:membrane fusion protein (multidrug efflux system)
MSVMNEVSPARLAGALPAGLALLCALFSVGCGRPDAGARSPADAPRLAVAVAEVRLGSLELSHQGPATLEAERETAVVAKTSGILIRLLAEEGDRVEAGQALARLDDERQRLELARAEANLARLENEFRRATELKAQRLLSEEAYERIRSDLAVQKAARDLAALELSYTEVRAPITGVILERMVKEGNLIQPNQALFRIASFRPLLAVLHVPEREFERMRPGLPVLMAVDALGGEVFAGRVLRVSPALDAGSGTFRVTAIFDDPSERLRAGMFGRLRIVYERREGVPVVPREALIEEDGRIFAFRIGDGRAQRVALRIGASDGPVAEVLAGLEPGDKVATVGRQALRDGAEVMVIESEGAASPAPPDGRRDQPSPEATAEAPPASPAPAEEAEPAESAGD